jgi:hypothetical protein
VKTYVVGVEYIVTVQYHVCDDRPVFMQWASGRGSKLGTYLSCIQKYYKRFQFSPNDNILCSPDLVPRILDCITLGSSHDILMGQVTI